MKLPGKPTKLFLDSSTVLAALFSKSGGSFRLFKESEEEKILEIGEELKKNVIGENEYKSRGICYLFLNGENLVPALQKYLPTNKPSTWQESVVRV